MVSTLDIFKSLDGRVFDGERAFQAAVIDSMNAYIGQLPPRYNHLNAISWAMKQKWLQIEGSTIRVDLPQDCQY